MKNKKTKGRKARQKPNKGRAASNREILRRLSVYLAANPNQRLGQALINLGVVEDDGADNLFNEEPREALKRMAEHRATRARAKSARKPMFTASQIAQARLRIDAEIARINSREFNERVNELLFANSPHIYCASPIGGGYVDRVSKDGTRVPGRIVGDQWAPLDVDEDHEALGAFNSRLIDGPDKVCPNISAVTDPRNFVPLSVEAAAKPKPPAPSGWYDSSFRKAEVFYKDELAGLLTEERKDGKIFYSFRYYRPYKEGPGPAISPDLPKESDIPLNSEPYSVFSEMIGSGERREKQQEYFNLKSDDLFTLLAIVGLRGYPVSVVPISYQPREVRAVRKRAVVYFLGQVAGFLTQVGHRGKTHYRFRYADAYLKSEHPMLSANLPKFPQVYISNRLFGIFEGLLCEGESRQIQQRAFGLSPDDLFGLLMITGPNSLSAITVAPTGTDHSPHATPVSLQRKPKA